MATSVRVYRYGVLAPTVEGPRVHEQMWKAHLYRNDLVQIERGRRDAVRAVLSRYGDLAVLEQTCVTAQEVLRAAQHAARAERVTTSSRRNTAEVADAVTRAKAAVSTARARVTATRKAARTDGAAVHELAVIEERAGELRRAARALAASRGLYWGTYQLVEDAMQQSARAPLYDGLEPQNPRFHRFEGEGQVSAQIMGGLATDAVTSTESRDTRVRLEHVADRRPGRDVFRLLHLRVGSNPDRSPIFATFPLKLHRPLPPGTIKRVTVDLKRRGPKPEWSVLFTLEVPEGDLLPRGAHDRVEKCGRGAIAIDLGWRRLPTGELRVATTFDGERSSELRLSEYTMESFQKVDGLIAIRDRLFLSAVSAIRDVRAIASAPEWFRERTAHVHQWRSEARMVSLINRWTRERFAGDELAFDKLATWKKTDHHLWWYESGAAINVHRRRREGYRVWAAQAARRYATLVLEDFDLSAVARTPPIGRDTQQAELARWQRRVAATSELRRCLIDAFVARGGQVVKVDPAETTMTCAECKIVEVFDAAAKIRHTCANGHTWDQDVNAAKNILERLGGAKEPGPARRPRKSSDPAPADETRWSRARRLAEEKRVRNEAAREPPPSPT